MKEVILTKKLKLYPPNKEKGTLLERISKTQTECVNFWIDKIRETGNTKLKELQSKFYREARERFGLSGELTQCAEMSAIRMARTAKKKRSNSPYLSKNILNCRSIKIENNNIGFCFGDRKSIWFPFRGDIIPVGKISESKVKKNGDNWFVFLSIKISVPESNGYKRFIGVDVGLSKIAAVSDWNGDNTKIFSGGELRNRKNHYFNLKKKLQPKIKKGNIYKLLKRISRKESNWTKTKNHEISKSIVNLALSNKRAISVENLTGFRKNIKSNKEGRRMLHSWSFRQLIDFIKYKARLAGLPDVLVVNPRNTSRTCPKCHYLSKNNRKSQERFICDKCRYESNADRVAAINIAQRAMGLLAS